MPDFQSDPLTELAGSLFEAAPFPDDRTAALDELRRHFGGSRACIQFYDQQGMPFLSANSFMDTTIGEEVIALGPGQLPAYITRLAAIPGHLLYRQSRLMPDQELHDMPVWRKIMCPRDMYGGIGWRIDLGHRGWCMVDIQRSKGRNDFDDRDRRDMSALGSVFRRVAKIILKSEQSRVELARLRTVLEGLDTGVLLMDHHFQIIDINRVAMTSLARIGIDVIAGDLIARREHARRVLKWIDTAMGKIQSGNEGPNPLSLVLECDDISTVFHVEPLRPDIDQPTCILVEIRQRGIVAPNLVRQSLSSAFNLTPREAEIAAEIVKGRSVNDISSSAGTSKTTIRSQLASLFAKTRTSRQTELALRLKATLQALDQDGPLGLEWRS
jgi:DNA-binding CsgD family transcriptional regulator